MRSKLYFVCERSPRKPIACNINIPWGASSPPDPLDLALWRQGPRPRRSHCGKGPWQRTQKREKQREKGQSKERRHKGIHKHRWRGRRPHYLCFWQRAKYAAPFMCLLFLLCPFSLCFSLFCVHCQGPLPQWDLRGLGHWRQSARSRGSGGLEPPGNVEYDKFYVFS